MPINIFLVYWVIWNFYWSIPYSFFWQRFFSQKIKWAVSLSMVIFFFIFQIIVPLIVFTHFFEIGDYSPFSLIGSFALLCMPAMVCNKLISKLSAVKFAVAVSYTLVTLVVIIGWVYLWTAYLDAAIVDPVKRFCSLGCWGIVIPIMSCLFIRGFLKTETRNGSKKGSADEF